jgi:hypothetical protein
MTTTPDINQPDICQLALQKISSLIDGNGLTVNNIKIINQNQTTLKIEGCLKINSIPIIQEKIVFGQIQNGIKASSQTEKSDHISNAVGSFLKDASVQNNILQKIKLMPNQGWGSQNQEIQIEPKKHIFYHTEACKSCHGQSETECQTCQGRGVMPCNLCHGQGRITCIACKGMRDILMPDGSEKPCIKCQQQGSVFCTQCQGQKNISCSNCQGLKKIACKTCGKTCVQNHVSYLDIKTLMYLFSF